MTTEESIQRRHRPEQLGQERHMAQAIGGASSPQLIALDRQGEGVKVLPQDQGDNQRLHVDIQTTRLQHARNAHNHGLMQLLYSPDIKHNCDIKHKIIGAFLELTQWQTALQYCLNIAENKKVFVYGPNPQDLQSPHPSGSPQTT